MSILRVGLAVACVWLWGCSFITVNAPPPDHEKRIYFDCTTTRLAPVLDMGVAGLAGAEAVATALGSGSVTQDRPFAIGLLVGLAALEVASGVHGFQATSRCDRAKAELAQRSETRAAEAPAAVPVQIQGCKADVECKGERICVAGSCVDPPAATRAPPEAPPPAPQLGTPPTEPAPPQPTEPAPSAPSVPSPPP